MHFGFKEYLLNFLKTLAHKLNTLIKAGLILVSLTE